MNALMPLLFVILGTVPPAYTQEAPMTSDETDALRREIDALRDEVDALKDSPAEAAGADLLDEPNERVGLGHAAHVAVGEQVDEAVAFGDDVTIAGRVTGDAVSFGGNVVVEPTGQVDGDAVAFGGVIKVRPGGTIAGDQVAMTVPGSITHIEPAGDEHHAVGSVALATDVPTLMHRLYRRLVMLLSVAGAGVLVVGLFPNRVARVAQSLERRPVRSAVVGTLASMFIGAFALLFTLVTLGLGLPVSAVAIGILGVAWLLGFVGLCQAVGDRLPIEQRPHGRWLAFLVGIGLLTFLGSLPWVGWLVVGAASVLGVGASLSTRFGGR